MKDGSSPTYCVLTYDTPHRKTQDLLMRLRSLGHTNVTVIATPWVERQSFVPLIPHRPQLMCDLPSQTFTENMGYAFERVTNEELADALRSWLMKNISELKRAGAVSPENKPIDNIDSVCGRSCKQPCKQ